MRNPLNKGRLLHLAKKTHHFISYNIFNTHRGNYWSSHKDTRSDYPYKHIRCVAIITVSLQLKKKNTCNVSLTTPRMRTRKTNYEDQRRKWVQRQAVWCRCFVSTSKLRKWIFTHLFGGWFQKTGASFFVDVQYNIVILFVVYINWIVSGRIWGYHWIVRHFIVVCNGRLV